MSSVVDTSWSIALPPRGPTTTRFERHCEAEFEHLAAHHPSGLIDLIAGGELEPSLLTFAAEIVGSVGPADMPRALHVLLPLLNHERPHVREGAVYGIGRIAMLAPQAGRFLQGVADDVSENEGVRSAARSVLGRE